MRASLPRWVVGCTLGTICISGLPGAAFAHTPGQGELGTPSVDQAAGDREQTGLQDIIVTAQKRSESVNSVGMSISVLSGVDLSYSTFDHIEARGFVSGPLSDTLRARLSFRSDRKGDWQRSHTHGGTPGESNIAVARRLLEWRPASNLTLLLNVNGWRERSDNQAGQLIATGGNTAPLPPALVNYPRAPQDARAADWTPGTDFNRDQDYFQVSVRGAYEFGDGLTLQAGARYTDQRRTFAACGAIDQGKGDLSATLAALPPADGATHG